MDGLQEILYTLRQNKLRTLLTAFGVFWGILMLILLLGAGKGMQNGIYASFGTEVRDFIVVYTETTSVAHNGRGLGRRIELTLDDIAALKDKISSIRFIASDNQRGGIAIIHENKSGSFNVHGVPDEFFDIKEGLPINFGRKMNPLDQRDTRKITMIGSVVAERIFGKTTDPTGKLVRVNNVVMTVVGVFHDKGDRGRDSERIYIPQSTFQKMFGNTKSIGAIWLRPKQGSDGFTLETDVIALLQQRHDVSPEDKRAIRSFNMAEPAKMVNGLFIAINSLIWFVGLGTLTAGIVGVSNIMIITVKERTREIGIRKALGATPFNIVATLLMESVLVTSVAGYSGLILGVGVLELLAFGLRSAGADLPFFQNPEVNFQVVITAIILLVMVGALAGLMPALRAARIMPTEAMRAD
jgi:putative ABC transport system permease protein